VTGFAEGYVDVAERIKKFKDAYPEGSLQDWRAPYLQEAGDKTYVVYAAAAYRTADDQRPGIGYAWELVPGPTPYTKDSELMNAETSAWGRAIAALGFEVHNGIATKQEVQSAKSRQGEDVSAGNAEWKKGDKATEKQVKYAQNLLDKFPPDTAHTLLGSLSTTTLADLPKGEIGDFITKLKNYEANGGAGPANVDDDIPFQ
jgi:hypothetical protein